jgi:hypothetical protein
MTKTMQSAGSFHQRAAMRVNTRKTKNTTVVCDKGKAKLTEATTGGMGRVCMDER